MANTKRDTGTTASQPPDKLKPNPDSVKDLTPSARAGGHVKGGIPRLNGSGGVGTGGGS